MDGVMVDDYTHHWCKLSRLDLPLRGGGGGPTRGGNAQLLSRSRPRWEREWKVVLPYLFAFVSVGESGVCSHSSFFICICLCVGMIRKHPNR